MFLFSGLRHRTVVLTLIDGTTVRGQVLRAGWLVSRISQPEIMEKSGSTPIEGVVRIPHRSVISIQEL